MCCGRAAPEPGFATRLFRNLDIKGDPVPIGGLSIGELILIFAVLLLLFGPKRLPELAAGVGKGIRDFKRSLNGLDERPLAPPVYQQPLPAQAVPAVQSIPSGTMDVMQSVESVQTPEIAQPAVEPVAPLA